jgi:hypothetical protein
MGCRILETKDGRSVFYCSSSDWAFGPVMESVSEAEAFAKWLHEDPRGMKDAVLESRYFEFRQLTPEQKHEAGLCETLGIEYECKLCEEKRKAEDAQPFDMRLSLFIHKKVST